MYCIVSHMCAYTAVLGLFSVVHFNNAVCNTTSDGNGGDEQGVCFTSAQCQQMGGDARGACAAGFGVCCLCQMPD